MKGGSKAKRRDCLGARVGCCRDRETPECYLVGSSCLVLCLASRLCMVFGSKCSEVVAKFMADNEFREFVISVLLQEV